MADLTPEELTLQGTAMVNHLHAQLTQVIGVNADLVGRIAILEARNQKLASDLDIAQAAKVADGA